jgi:hypothetical protein
MASPVQIRSKHVVGDHLAAVEDLGNLGLRLAGEGGDASLAEPVALQQLEDRADVAQRERPAHLRVVPDRMGAVDRIGQAAPFRAGRARSAPLPQSRRRGQTHRVPVVRLRWHAAPPPRVDGGSGTAQTQVMNRPGLTTGPHRRTEPHSQLRYLSHLRQPWC